MRVKFHFFSFLIILLVFSHAFAQKAPPKIYYDKILNEKAITLPEPAYPAAARAVRAFGAVNVQVTVNENGDVISAAAVSGHPLLRAAAVQAARQAKFAPATVDGQNVTVLGILIYTFIFPEQWQDIGEALGDSEVEIETENGLLRASEILANVLPEISQSLKTIAENYVKDEETGRFQTGAVGEIIVQLQTRTANRPRDLWHFELGLTAGRIKANYFDENVLRSNLQKLKELADSYPASDNRTLESESWAEYLIELGEMAHRQFYSRKDKSKIKRLVDYL
jgi:TonB family protein